MVKTKLKFQLVIYPAIFFLIVGLIFKNDIFVTGVSAGTNDLFGNANNGEWAKRQEIQINPDKVAGDLVNFPMLITEDNLDSDIFAQALENGCDLRFSTSGNESDPKEIPFEIVSFDKLNHTTEIWVNVPQISSSATTSIWVWWGNHFANCYAKDDIYGTHNVWDEHYKGVWHLEENGNGTINEFVDSTRNNNHGTGGGGASSKTPSRVMGKIGKGQNFDGLNDYIEILDSASLDLSSIASFNFIFNSNHLHDYRILSKNSVGKSDGYAIDTQSQKLRFVGCGTTAAANYILSIGQYYSGAFVFESPGVNKQHFYLDGTNIKDVSLSDNIYINNLPLRIGSAASHESNFFNGILDEIRILDIALSQNWISTEYNNQNSPGTFAVGQAAQAVGQPGIENFSFVHMTDVHLGSSWVPGHRWSEELSYPRFTDGLYEIERMAEAPDFVLISGDLVEYANSRWLEDYQSLVDNFTAQSGIPVYTEPGNHDRYRGATGNAKCYGIMGNNCEDGLSAYNSIINAGTQNNVDYLTPSNNNNFKFEHNGYQFVGLDSGGDYMPDYEFKDVLRLNGDQGIEGNGLSNSILTGLTGLDSEIPKIVFMHHPAISGSQDSCDGLFCASSVLEDASFANNHNQFIEWASSSNVELVLAGHTHQSRAFNRLGTEYTDLSAATDRPLFIQTQSATHDGEDKHGYRLIKVEDGAVYPQNISETKDYNKLIFGLGQGEGLEFWVYDPDNPSHFVNMNGFGNLLIPYFIASSSRKAFVYGPQSNYAKMEVLRDSDDAGKQYDLEARFEGENIGGSDENDFGYYTDSWAKGMLNYHVEKNVAQINLKKINIFGDDKHQLAVNWDDLISTGDPGDLLFSRDIGNSGAFEPNETMIPMRSSIIAKLFSPAELVVINKDGKRTGVIDHEPVEEIDYSLSDAERERVLVYSKDNFAGDDFVYRVQGIDDVYGEGGENYSLKIDYRIDGQATKEVNIADIPVNASTTHQFRVDWDNLCASSGVIMEIDNDGDGIFEHSQKMGSEITGEEYLSDNPNQLRKKAIKDLENVKNNNKKINKKIEGIIHLINRSLKDSWWQDEYHLNAKNGAQVFKTDLKTARIIKLYLGLDRAFSNKKYIPKFLKNKFSLPKEVKTVFESTLHALLRSDIILAQTAVEDFAKTVNSKKENRILKTAERKLARAKKLLSNKSVMIIQLSRQVWQIVN